jgi:hypothetical protein
VYGFCETPASVSWYDGVAKRPDTGEDNKDAGDVAEGYTIRSLNHVPVIDINPRAIPELKRELEQEAKRQRLVGHRLAEDIRYGECSTAERVNGGRTLRVRGPAKVMCHLMFGVLSFTALQRLHLVT